MTVQASVNINFQCDTEDEVDAIVKGLTLPDGAMVNASVTSMVASGQVVDGTIQSMSPVPPPPTGTEPAPLA